VCNAKRFESCNMQVRRIEPGNSTMNKIYDMTSRMLMQQNRWGQLAEATWSRIRGCKMKVMNEGAREDNDSKWRQLLSLGVPSIRTWGSW
jgi:hypothetical protein